MEKTPVICPECGEFVLAWRTGQHTLVVPLHPDRVTPWAECGARAVAMPSAGTRQQPSVPRD